MSITTPKDNTKLNRLYIAVRDAAKRLSDAEKEYINRQQEYQEIVNKYDELQRQLSVSE